MNKCNNVLILLFSKKVCSNLWLSATWMIPCTGWANFHQCLQTFCFSVGSGIPISVSESSGMPQSLTESSSALDVLKDYCVQVGSNLFIYSIYNISTTIQNWKLMTMWVLFFTEFIMLLNKKGQILISSICSVPSSTTLPNHVTECVHGLRSWHKNKHFLII